MIQRKAPSYRSFSSDLIGGRLNPADQLAAPDALSPPTSAGNQPGPVAESGQQKESAHLFGRGLLYVIVWSLQLVAGTVVSPILAHVMGPAEFGALASAIALHQVLSVLALLGLDQALMLQRVGDSDARAARSLVSLGIALSFVVCIVIAVTSPLWRDALGFGHYPALVIAVILWTAPTAALQVMLSLLLTEDRIRPFALISALAAVGGQLCGIVLLLSVHNDATTYAWGGVGSQFAAMLIGIIVTRPRLRGMFNRKLAVRAFALGAPLALGGLAYFVLNAGDRVIIQRLLGAEEVGRYQVAYVVGSVVVLLLTFTSSAWTPRFAALNDITERFALAALSRDALYRLLSPMLVGITLVAPIALRIVAPASFRPESLSLVVFLVALSAFPVAASGATGRILITLRRGKTIGAIAGIAAVVNVGLNLLLVPLVGIQGAAAATLVSYLCLAFLQRRAMPSTPPWTAPTFSLTWRVAVPITLAGATLLVPQTLDWNIGRLLVGAACLPWFIVTLRRARSGPTAPPLDDVSTNSTPTAGGSVSADPRKEFTVPEQLPTDLTATDRMVTDDRLLPDAPPPRRVISVDLEAPLPTIVADSRYESALVVGWRDGVPIGAADVDLRKNAPELRHQLAALFTLASNSSPALPAVADAMLPAISVIVSTIYERKTDLAILLNCFSTLEYPRVEYVVVDNRPIIPAGDTLAALVAEHRFVRLVREPRPGISAGRNAGLAATSNDIVVFTDDDVRVGADWLRAIGTRLVRQPALQAVTGLILPSELETPAQIWFERYYGGFSGERTYSPLTLEPHRGSLSFLRYSRVNVLNAAGNRQRQFAVYGVGSFGAGANMAFRRSALDRIGAFDVALGTGTPSRGGEDLAVLVSILWQGGQIGFEPNAVVHHRHRQTFEGLVKQLRGNGVGFTAMMASLIRTDSRHALAIGSQLPLAGFQVIRQGIGRLAATRSRRHSDRSRSAAQSTENLPADDGSSFTKTGRTTGAEPLTNSYPRGLMINELSRYPLGPVAYLRSRRVTRLQAPSESSQPVTTVLTGDHTQT